MAALISSPGSASKASNSPGANPRRRTKRTRSIGADERTELIVVGGVVVGRVGLLVCVGGLQGHR